MHALNQKESVYFFNKHDSKVLTQIDVTADHQKARYDQFVRAVESSGAFRMNVKEVAERALNLMVAVDETWNEHQMENSR